MKSAQILTALTPIDVKSIYRDNMLRWIVVFPLLSAVMLRWGIPYLTAYLTHHYQFDLTPYYVLILSFNLLLMPSLVGLVIGFLLLDQRDDDTLTALQVSPLSLNGYLAYRIAIPLMLSVALTILLFWIADLVSIRFAVLLTGTLMAAPFAPIYALFLASFAHNKVQGFALGKAVGVVLCPPVLASFILSDWQLLFGLMPTYWSLKFFWLALDGNASAWWYVPVGLAYQLLLLFLLMQRFKRVVHR